MLSAPEQPVQIWGGMECTINRLGAEYFDQLDYSGHRDREGDIDLFAALGLKKMRYPVLWEHHQATGSGPVRWGRTEKRLAQLRGHGIDVIAGLVHHGSGPAFVQMTQDSFVTGLAGYAARVAQKFPWIEYYTPVNEPLTTARFCGLYGLWYPHQKDGATFCRILVNECKATVMAMAAIREINPGAKLVQTEDLGKVHSTPALKYQADFENARRWLSFDLLCGRVGAQHVLWDFLTGNGIGTAELDYFRAHPCPPDILGINYYLTSERYLDQDMDLYPVHSHGGNGKDTYADVEAVRVAKACPDGAALLLEEAWERYRLPIAVTEVHLHCTREEQMRWLHQSWTDANRLRARGVPVLAVTAWALLGSFGWERLLTCPPGTYESGVFDISSGYPRATVLAAMIRAYSRNESFDHPVLANPGWWQRSCRVSYGKELVFTAMEPVSGEPFSIGGSHAAELCSVCQARGLPFLLQCRQQQYNALQVVQTSIHINVNQVMEISRCGQQLLIIRLAPDSDLRLQLNAGLDLFLDGERGCWQLAAGRRLIRDMPGRLRVPYFDKAFVTAFVEGNQKTMAVMHSEASAGSQPQPEAVAAKTAPVVKMHPDAFDEIQAALK